MVPKATDALEVDWYCFLLMVAPSVALLAQKEGAASRIEGAH